MDVVVSGRERERVRKYFENWLACRETERAQGIDRTGGGKSHSNGLLHGKQEEIEREK